MRRPPLFLCFLLVISCQTRAPNAPSSTAAENPAPTNAEVLAYLEDKPLPVTAHGGRPLLIRQEWIEALSVRNDSVRSDAGPWRTGISFIYNNSRARYAVEAVVEHQIVGAQRVFQALRVRRIDALSGCARITLESKARLQYTRKPMDKAKVTILISRPISLEQLKKYASTKPLRRPSPLTKR
jgi:hypothetical protein